MLIYFHFKIFIRFFTFVDPCFLSYFVDFFLSLIELEYPIIFCGIFAAVHGLFTLLNVFVASLWFPSIKVSYFSLKSF